MRTLIGSIGIGAWYPRGIARMVTRFDQFSPGFDLMAWTNTLPPGAPVGVVVDGYDYTPYCAKPFALRALRSAGAEAGILLDAAFWPIRPIHPMLDHISEIGYYFCNNGNKVGEWCADSALGPLGITRDESFGIRELSSYCIGLRFDRADCNEFLDEWCSYAVDGVTFPGRHTQGSDGRNHGHCSNDPRVKGHRHDQTAASVIAWRIGMDWMVDRPKLTAYDGSQDERTVLVNRGGM